MFLQKSPSNFLSSQTWHISVSFSQKGKSTNVLSLYLQFHLTALPFTPLLFLSKRNGHCSSLILSIPFENKMSIKPRLILYSCTSDSSSTQLLSPPFEDIDPVLILVTAGSSVTKESDCSAENQGQTPGLGRSPGGGNGNPLQYPCLENSMDRGAWWATVHGVAKSRTRLND